MYELVQAKKTRKHHKCQSNMFFNQKLISGILSKVRKVKKAEKKLSKVVKVSKAGKLFYGDALQHRLDAYQ